MKAAHSRFLEMRLKARTGIWIEALGTLAVMLIVYAGLTLVIDRNLRLEWPFRLALLAGLLWFAVRALRERLLRPLGVGLSDDEMALAVERRSPELAQELISSVQFERALASEAALVDSRAMMQKVVEDVSARLHSIPFLRALDAARVRRFAALMALGVAVFGGWGVADLASLKLWALRNLALSSREWPRYTTFHFADVGTDGVLRVPQGDPCTIVAQVLGPIPDQVFMNYAFKGGDSGAEPMSATGDREFTWMLPAVLEDTTLWATGGDGLSDPLHLQVVERPRIEAVDVQVVYPPYMQKEPGALAPTDSEVKLPRGGYLQIKARSHKPIEQAFLLIGADKKQPLQRDDDHAFHGEYRPEATGLMEINVIDTDKLGSNAAPKLMVRLVDDRPPTLDLRLRGIGSMITPHARIPGDLKVKDDFGITEVAAGLRWVADLPADKRPPGQASEPAAEAPFVPVDVAYGSDLSRGMLRYDTTTMVDLMQPGLNPDPDQNSDKNKIRPGSLLALRFSAKDNFGPGAPHESYCELVTFRVVTSDKLLEELRRRQIELHGELQQIIDEERTAQTEIKEILSPSSSSDKAPQAKARLRALARQQTALGRRVAFVGESYQKVLWEFENNRMWDSAKVRQVEAVIPQPLDAMSKGDFPVTSRQVEAFAGSGDENARSELVAAYEEICKKLTAVMKNMEQAETLAAMLEQLRNVIKVQDNAIRDVEKRLREMTDKMFGPDGDKTPNKDEAKDGKKPK